MWGLINHSGPSMVDTLEVECYVLETSVNTLQMWSGRPSGCSDPLVWEKGVLWWLWWLKGVASTCKLDWRRSQNGKLGRTATCKPVLKKQEDSCPTWMAKGVIVGLVAINVQQPLMDGTVHWQMQQPIPSVKGWQPPLLKKSWSWQPPLLPINRHRERESKAKRKEERKRGCQGQHL